MFYMPITKARVRLVIQTDIDLDPASELTDEEQLDQLLKKIAENPQHLNRLEASQTLHGKVLRGSKWKNNSSRKKMDCMKSGMSKPEVKT